jgi:hypothetical protein
MISANHIGVSTVQSISAGNTTATNGRAQYQEISATNTTSYIPCGCASLPAGDYIVKLNIGKADGTTNGTGGKAQCVLYLPSYIMSLLYLERYTAPSIRNKKIYYTNLEYQSFKAYAESTFTVELASSVVRPVRLIMIGIMTGDATVAEGSHKGGNEGIEPMSSPWTTELATTSPFILTNFNCSVASTNMYQNDINYSFDHYLQSLNGSSGINSNIVSGLCSSSINMIDFQNNYHDVIVDLSRTTPDKIDVAKNVKVRGLLQSNRDMIFHCFIEKENYIEIDSMTGVLIPKKN